MSRGGVCPFESLSLRCVWGNGNACWVRILELGLLCQNTKGVEVATHAANVKLTSTVLDSVHADHTETGIVSRICHQMYETRRAYMKPSRVYAIVRTD